MKRRRPAPRRRDRLLLLVVIAVLAAGALFTAGTVIASTVDAATGATTAAESMGAGSVDTTATGAACRMTVHFIDVDQGDATLLVGNDFTILVDAGRHDHNDVVPYLKSAGLSSLDLLIGTHPHADHIGQFPQVLRTFPVREVWLAGDVHTTRTYERALDAIIAGDAAYVEPRAGDVRSLGSARVEVLNPLRLTGDLHKDSIALRVVCGYFAIVFTGDAPGETEQAMVGRGAAVRADVLQLGHHGSSTSSSRRFLTAVRPAVAVYSAAQGNPYGHPHREVIERLARLGIHVVGTDVHGSIRVQTDGQKYTLSYSGADSATVWTLVAAGATPNAPEQATRSKAEPAEKLAKESEDGSGAEAGSGAGTGCLPGQVDINTAATSDLIRIINIGESRAKRLIELRPYAKIDDLTRIRGIGETRLVAIKDQALACVSAE